LSLSYICKDSHAYYVWSEIPAVYYLQKFDYYCSLLYPLFFRFLRTVYLFYSVLTVPNSECY